jgi:hypothetical protein
MGIVHTKRHFEGKLKRHIVITKRALTLILIADFKDDQTPIFH